MVSLTSLLRQVNDEFVDVICNLVSTSKLMAVQREERVAKTVTSVPRKLDMVTMASNLKLKLADFTFGSEHFLFSKPRGSLGGGFDGFALIHTSAPLRRVRFSIPAGYSSSIVVGFAPTSMPVEKASSYPGYFLDMGRGCLWPSQMNTPYAMSADSVDCILDPEAKTISYRTFRDSTARVLYSDIKNVDELVPAVSIWHGGYRIQILRIPSENPVSQDSGCLLM